MSIFAMYVSSLSGRLYGGRYDRRAVRRAGYFQCRMFACRETESTTPISASSSESAVPP